MANAKAGELRDMTVDSLKDKINEMEANLFNLRFQASLGKLENTDSLRISRRDIARAKTELGKKSGSVPRRRLTRKVRLAGRKAAKAVQKTTQAKR